MWGKTNACIGGGGVTSIPNLLDGTTWTGGYVAQNGSIANPDGTRKEIYSDYIDIGTSARTLLFLTHTHNTNPWMGIGFYNANKSAVSRQVADYSRAVGDGSYWNYLLYCTTGSDNIRYIRFSYRNYGDTTNEAGMFDINEIPNFILPLG